MAILTYKGGKYRSLVGNKIYDGEKWLKMSANSKIYLNGKWHNLSFKKSGFIDLPDIETPEFPELNGPTLTEENLIHENVTEPTTGNVYYMTPTGNGNMDGSSWNNAYPIDRIEEALFLCSSGDRIYMSEGDYGTLSQPISIPDGVSIYGGFIEEDPRWEKRDSFNHSTVLDGNNIYSFEFKSENSTKAIEIDGLTCKNFKTNINNCVGCTFRNITLVNGEFRVSTNSTNLKIDLVNSKSSNCSIFFNGNVDKFYNVCTIATNCTILGELKNSTIDLKEGNLMAEYSDTDNCYITSCNNVVLNSLTNSEIVNSKTTVKGNVNDVKCYGESIEAYNCNNVFCDENITCTGCCIDCKSKNITCNNSVGCTCYESITCNGDCINSKSKNITCNNSEGCTCYENYNCFTGKNNRILNSKIYDYSIETQFNQINDNIQCDYYISNGLLYYKDNTQVGIESGWTHVCGYSDSSKFAYGIRSGYLYALQGTTATKISQEYDWTYVSDYSNSSSTYAYGIRNGYLYSLRGTTVKQISTESGWTHVCGHSVSTSTYSSCAYGIRDGYLYALQGDTSTKISQEYDWTNISGYSNSGSIYAYGIRSGYLYALQGTTVTQISGESGWTHVCGCSDSSTYAYGIRDGYLYSLKETTVTKTLQLIKTQPYQTDDSIECDYYILNGLLYYKDNTQVGIESGWTHVCGYSNHDNFAYGIRNGYLYVLKGTTVTQISTESGWTNICGFSNSGGVYAYGIREIEEDGYLYALQQGTTVTQISTESGWTNICGYSISGATYAYGIREIEEDGYLYALQGTTVTKISTESGWTNISGCGSDYAYGIRDGYLYSLKETTVTKTLQLIETKPYQTDDSVKCEYYILGGFLYYKDNTQVGIESGWTHVCGYSDFSYRYAYGIRDGYLYALQKTTATQVGTESGWTNISGYSYSNSDSNSDYTYAYGIRNGCLYSLLGTTVTQVGTESGWTHICGYSISGATYAYGIREIEEDGYLYNLQGTTVKQVGTESGWTNISGYSGYSDSVSNICAFGIREGCLYCLRQDALKQISEESGWTHVCGYSGYSDSKYIYAYGIREGYLYRLNINSVIQINIGSGWTNISGYSYSDSTYAYGIRNGCLYSLLGATVTQVGTESGWTHVCGCYNFFNDYAYGIRDGYLYDLGKDKIDIIKVGEVKNGWTHVCGHSNSSYRYAYGIRDSYLYSLKENIAKKISKESGWTNISGHSDSDNTYAYGIRSEDGYLYSLLGTTVTQVGTKSGWTHVFGYSGSSSDNKCAYGIRDVYIYSLRGATETKISTINDWTDISGYSNSSYRYAYGIRNGCLYLLQENKFNQIGTEIGWTHVSGSFDSSSNSYAYGIRDGELYEISSSGFIIKEGNNVPLFNNCFIINCQKDDNLVEVENSKVFNSKLNTNTTSKNSLIVNCEGDILNSTYCTIVNSKSSVSSGEYNVYWNNDGSVLSDKNAQTEFSEGNLVTLYDNNDRSKFTSTGYYPSKGIQDLGDCPDPISDEEGYNEYISSFGNWVPQSDSLLIGKGIKDSNITKDLNGKERPENPTLGAYEP